MKCPECGKADLRVITDFGVGTHGHPLVCRVCTNMFLLMNGAVYEGETLPADPVLECDPEFKEMAKQFPLSDADWERLPFLADIMKPAP